jgi:hypothetical protein
LNQARAGLEQKRHGHLSMRTRKSQYSCNNARSQRLHRRSNYAFIAVAFLFIRFTSPATTYLRPIIYDTDMLSNKGLAVSEAETPEKSKTTTIGTPTPVFPKPCHLHRKARKAQNPPPRTQNLQRPLQPPNPPHLLAHPFACFSTWPSSGASQSAVSDPSGELGPRSSLRKSSPRQQTSSPHETRLPVHLPLHIPALRMPSWFLPRRPVAKVVH